MGSLVAIRSALSKARPEMPVDLIPRFRVEDLLRRPTDHLFSRLSVETEGRRIDLLIAKPACILTAWHSGEC